MPDGQLSLLDWIDPAQARESREAPFVRSPNEEWNTFIAGAAALERTRFHVSVHWTGTVLERLIDFKLGHWLLWSNGRRVEYGPSPHPSRDQHIRVVYKSLEGAQALHRSFPLVRELGGPGWAQYRFAGPDEPCGELDMPRAHDP